MIGCSKKMRWISFGIILQILFINIQLNAQSQMDTIDWTPQSRLVVRCPVAEISFIEMSSKNITVQSQLLSSGKPQGHGWNFRLEKSGSTTSILCDPPAAVLEKNSNLKYSIQIKGPSLPVLASIRFGGIDISNLKEPFSLTLENGYVRTRNTQQFFNLHVLNGSIEVENHSGRLKVDAYDSKTKISKVDGKVDINHFSGQLFLKDVDGEVYLDSQKTNIVASHLSAGLRFHLGAGKLDLDGMSGAVEGEVDQSVIQAQLLNPVRFKVKAKVAAIKLNVPGSSGAQVHCSLGDGQFVVPSFLSQDNSGQVKLVKGALRGSESGRISVTADSGRVQLSTN